MTVRTRIVLVLGTLVLCFGAVYSGVGLSSAASQAVDRPGASVPAHVWITGDLQAGSAGSVDLADYASKSVSFPACYCPWIGTEHSYRGILLLDLLEELGMAPDSPGVELRGANGYKVRIRTEDLRRHRYLVAFEMDGIPLRDHPDHAKLGQVVTVVDFADPDEVNMGVYKFQFVWKLEEIRVL